MAESPSDLMAAISARLSSSGMPSARRLAEKSGWGRTLVNDVKLGRRLPNGTQLQDILTAAGVQEPELSQWADRLANARDQDLYPSSDPELSVETSLDSVIETMPSKSEPTERLGWRISGRAFRSLTIVVIAVLLLGLLATGLWWASRPQIDVTGKVRCSTGQPVVGVWVQSQRNGGGYGKVRRGEDGWFTYNGWAIADHGYRLHVGCGGRPESWISEARTGRVTAPNLTVLCDDSPAVLAVPPYLGRCSVQE